MGHYCVHIEKEISCPKKYLTWSQGWYLDKEEMTAITEENIYLPPFLSAINSNSWEQFEDNTYRLLRLLGIHNIHQYPRTSQKGLPDGFFKFGKMAVIYDCTLENDFEKTKNTQIDNFCSQLSKNKITVGIQEYGVKDSDKYIWIITRRNSSRIIKKSDDITVKEISVQALISIYNERLQLSNIDEKELEKRLKEV